MAKTYNTNADDALDLICHKIYGIQAGIVEIVLALNPHIQNCPNKLPKNTLITLPDLNQKSLLNHSLRLWD